MPETEYVKIYKDGRIKSAFDLSGWPQDGQKVRFLNRNGYDYQLNEARRVFWVSKTYTISRCVVNLSSSYYEFEEVPGKWNTVMFKVINNEV